jgi:hypothetical protein
MGELSSVAGLLMTALRNRGDRDRQRRDRVADYLLAMADTVKEMLRIIRETGETPTGPGKAFKRLIEQTPSVMYEILDRRDEGDVAQVDRFVAELREIDAIAENIDLTLAAREERLLDRAPDERAWNEWTYRMVRDRVKQIEREMADVTAAATHLRATSP